MGKIHILPLLPGVQKNFSHPISILPFLPILLILPPSLFQIKIILTSTNYISYLYYQVSQIFRPQFQSYLSYLSYSYYLLLVSNQDNFDFHKIPILPLLPGVLNFFSLVFQGFQTAELLAGTL